MAIGTVKFFNTTKGFGFIAPEGGAKDVFVHASAVEAAGLRSLSEGQQVSFDIQPDAKGSKATNLKAIWVFLAANGGEEISPPVLAWTEHKGDVHDRFNPVKRARPRELPQQGVRIFQGEGEPKRRDLPANGNWSAHRRN